MGIYTRTGDKGLTSTLSGERHPKSDLLFEVGGTLDELSAHLGLLRAGELAATADVAAFVRRIQEDFVPLGAYISAGDPVWLDQVAMRPDHFERLIDAVLAARPIEGFVQPGENLLEARLHLARTVCRRFERRLVALGDQRPDPRAGRYVNRLSDLLFALALWARAPFALPLDDDPAPPA